MKQLGLFVGNFIGMACGVFAGNFLFHALAGNYFKGVLIGSIAVVILLCFYILAFGVWTLIRRVAG